MERVSRVWSFVEEYSLLLVIGAVLALIAANAAPHFYHALLGYEIWHDGPFGHLHDDGHGHVTRTLTMHFLVNDILMAFFFAVAGKEVWEAVALTAGPLRGKKALTPLIATAGGMIGPATVYLLGAVAVGKFTMLANGWAIPTATDIAFSYLVGRLVFGAGHPAVGFLLLLAIADDAAGLVILAVFYPQGALAPAWLLLSAAAALAAYFGFNKLPRRFDRGRQDRPYSTFVRRRLFFWPYLIAACLSWYGFYRAGIHPALGLLPIVPAIPHSEIDFGIFAAAEAKLPDLLNRFEHILKSPVEVILFLFGFMNAGVEFSAMGDTTWLVLAGLLVGKPLGILAFGWFAASGLKLGLPEGMKTTDLFVLGCVAAIGFTVSLFVADVAFPPGAIQDAAKMGALMSFGAAAMALVAGTAFRIDKVREQSDAPASAH